MKNISRILCKQKNLLRYPRNNKKNVWFFFWRIEWNGRLAFQFPRTFPQRCFEGTKKREGTPRDKRLALLAFLSFSFFFLLSKQKKSGFWGLRIKAAQSLPFFLFPCVLVLRHHETQLRKDDFKTTQIDSLSNFKSLIQAQRESSSNCEPIWCGRVRSFSFPLFLYTS